MDTIKEHKILIQNIKPDTCPFCQFPAVIGYPNNTCPNCHAEHHYIPEMQMWGWEIKG